MRAMVLESVGEPLVPKELPDPQPSAGQVRVRVRACGVCRTDLHVADGDLEALGRPVVLGHQIVGEVEQLGANVSELAVGQRIGIPWLGWTCGACRYCSRDQENLCDSAEFTGYHRDGGFAELAVADARWCFPLPDNYPDAQVAPLMCAGLIGHRAHRMVADAERIGLYGFGAAAHILIQVAVYENKEVYAFTRRGDDRGQAFARSLGAAWAGSSEDEPPSELDAAIIFAPVGALLPTALAAVRKGGTVVCAGIHMSEIPGFSYDLLWGERTVRSVANLTRLDGRDFLELAPRVPVRTQVTTYPLQHANDALEDLRRGVFEGAAVILLD